MPNYVYRCPVHGDFDKRAGYDQGTIEHGCGAKAVRQTVYPINVVMVGQTMPPRDDAHSDDIHDELGKVMIKRGYGGKDQAIQEIRDNMVVDETGARSLDRSNMTKTC